MIKVSHLSRSYGKFQAVKDVSFEVEKGRILGLLGPNGAGKTTLMKILTGSHFPTSGQAWINGIDIEQDPQAAQSLVGYLPESSPVYQDLTVLEYLEFMAGAKGLESKSIPALLDKTMELTDVGQFRNKVIGHLSKGQKQRVGLAQAILGDPQILILDEPTTGLDPNQIMEFRRLIQNIGNDRTVILSTHIMQEVEAICERVLIMNQGSIVAEGKASEIAKSFQGEERLRFTLKKVPYQKAVSDLKTLEGQNSEPQVLAQGENPEIECSFPLSGSISGAEKLFDWAVKNDYKLLSLVPRTLSLEDLFVQLTKEVPHE